MYVFFVQKYNRIVFYQKYRKKNKSKKIVPIPYKKTTKISYKCYRYLSEDKKNSK